MTIIGTTQRELTIKGVIVPAGTSARQLALSGEGKSNYCVIIPGVGTKYLCVSAVN